MKMRKKVLMNLLMASILACLVMGCGSSETKKEETSAKVEETTEDSEKIQDNQADIADNEETTDEEIITDEPQEESEPEIEQRENTDFRNACWGDSIEDVKKYETEAEYVDEDEGVLLYSDSLLGTKVNIVYVFENNKLYRCAYMCTSEYTTGGQYINAYNSWLEALTEKYGEPADDSGMRTTESQDLIDLAGESKALEYGYTAYVSYWDMERTNIKLGLTSENFDVSLNLYYTDASYKEDKTSNF